MTRTEFEERLRALEAQHQADIALMNAAHEARVRSLRSLWQGAADPGPAPPPAVPAQQPAPKTRRERNSVLQDLSEALPSLPASFDKHDIARALGYEPPHATLYRALRTLSREGLLENETFSSGNTTSRYRKLDPDK